MSTNRSGRGGISAVWSPDFEAYATGALDASAIRCALCEKAPCACPEFGSPEYFELLDRRHNRQKPAGE
jgi:hypothetical protein